MRNMVKSLPFAVVAWAGLRVRPWRRDEPASQPSRCRWRGHEAGATRWFAQLLFPRSRVKSHGPVKAHYDFGRELK